MNDDMRTENVIEFDITNEDEKEMLEALTCWN